MEGETMTGKPDKPKGHYSAHLKMPKNKKEGLCNFVQTIINHAEAGNTREALLSAVDLLDDLKIGHYDDALGKKAVAQVNLEKSNLEKQMEKDKSDLEHLGEKRYAEGFKAGDQARLNKILSSLEIIS
jgi:hypothetical protein